MASAQDLLTLTLGIIVSALPFVVLGVLVSVLLQLFIPTQKLIGKLPKNIIVRRLIVSCLGILMPVCECGNVPVARGLMIKGLSAEEATVFLLASPSVNLVTFIVTWEAFSFNHSVAIVRTIATLIVANLAAFVTVRGVHRNKLLTNDFAALCRTDPHTHRSLRGASELFSSEMWLIMRMLVLGALIAAASQTIVPRDAITAIGSNLPLSVIAMLALAFVVSICSNVNAFFALAYASTFNLGAILAFLVAGPMVDIRMLALLKTTYTFRALAIITGSVFFLTFLVGIGMAYVW